MGERDSSKTRVVPVFDHLVARDPSGTWVAPLLNLAEMTGGARAAPGPTGRLLRYGWGSREVPLRPPRSLLTWLVDHPERLRRPRDLGTKSSEVRKLRQRLLDGDPDVARDARRVLAQGQAPTRGWCVLEGATRPDVYLETEHLLVVIEGKRTERHPTMDTTWLSGRRQILRHLDCAWEIKGDREVWGLFIVEGGATHDALAVPKRWQEAAAETVTPAALADSLPQRTEAERGAIARSFLGATTWQAVCAAFDISWTDLPATISRT